jgi:hypothetical protein
MKRFLYHLLLFFVFIIGIYTGFIYAFFERHDLVMSLGNVFKYHIYNSFTYFLSLMVALWLLKYSSHRHNDFLLIGAMYGLASLMYDVIFVQIVGAILLLSAMLKVYFKLFPEDKFWVK